MQAKDIEVGQHYVATNTKDYLTYPYGNARVEVIDNELYSHVRMSSIPLSTLRADANFAKAHLAWALTEAFPRQSTPDEAHKARIALRQAADVATTAYYEADEMRAFRKGGYYTDGILVRRYLRKVEPREDGGTPLESWEPGKLDLVPRRDLRSTWETYVQQKKQADAQKAEANRAREARAAVRAAQRESIRPRLDALFEGDDMPSAPFVSNYNNDVTFSYEQLLALLDLIDSMDASLTKAEGV